MRSSTAWVLSIRRVSSATAATAGEHDPDWWAAVIRVIRSVKGEQGNDVEVRYPNSDDIAWYRVRSFGRPREGVFFLIEPGRRMAVSLLQSSILKTSYPAAKRKQPGSVGISNYDG